ncbi:MAG TPA: RNA-binding protein [Ktedonobacterales bacterium]|jgi:RNA recognition motif-containing protein
MSTRIYVGNLPYSATNEQIAQLFAEYGEVSEATVVMDRDSGRSKGFAFVQMNDDAAARTAIGALNGTTLDDRAIRVSEAQARVDRADGGRSRRDGGYRDGGYRDSRW